MAIRTRDVGPDRAALADKTAGGTRPARRDGRERGRARTIGALALAAACSAAASAAPAAKRMAACSFGAFVQESDPAGLDVRAAPNAAARILGTLPPGQVDHANGDFVARVEVDVLASTPDGWFRIAHARDNQALAGRPARAVYAGEGWVSGRKLTVKSQASQGRARPDDRSEVLLRLGNGESFDNDAMVSAGQLVGCDGAWARVEFADDRLPADVRRALAVAPAARSGVPDGRFRAWVDRLCSVQETTCDGDAAPR